MTPEPNASTWQEIAASIEARIMAGEFTPGSQLPSGDRLSRELGLNRSAVHRALEDLQRRGLVVRRKGSGTVVSERERPPMRQVALLADRLAPHLNHPSGDLIRGIKERLGEGVRLIVDHSADDLATEARQIQSLAEEMDGLILYPIARNDLRPIYERLRARGYPLVTLDRRHVGVECDAVFLEDREAVLHAVSAMLERGHRRVGYLSHRRPNFQSSAERFEGYRNALVAAGLDAPEEDIRWMPLGSALDPSGVFQVVQDALYALTRREHPITAIFCAEDQLTAAALQACASLGLRVPQDLEIVAVSDWPPETFLTPWNVNRIVPRKDEMGAAAAGLLLDRFTDPGRPLQTVRVPADFIPAGADLFEVAARP